MSRADDPCSARARRIEHEVARLGAVLGQSLRDERKSRGLSLGRVAGEAGLGLTTVHDVESGRSGSLETYARLADVLKLRAEFAFVDPRRRSSRAVDPVHAAMGEIEASRLRQLGFDASIDEPYQHFQFAGRADVVAWSRPAAALLHIENRTRFPDLQDAFGSFNAKRRYLGEEFARTAGVGRWRSETHVMASLWSAEVLRAIRTHAASFAGVCPDASEAFEGWWGGAPPASGIRSILVLFDPVEGRRSDRRRWLGLDELAGVRPRHRGYADVAARLSGRV